MYRYHGYLSSRVPECTQICVGNSLLCVRPSWVLQECLEKLQDNCWCTSDGFLTSQTWIKSHQFKKKKRLCQTSHYGHISTFLTFYRIYISISISDWLIKCLADKSALKVITGAALFWCTLCYKFHPLSSKKSLRSLWKLWHLTSYVTESIKPFIYQHYYKCMGGCLVCCYTACSLL